MLRSIKQLYGDKLGTSEGAFGHVRDFYFDDQRWTVRYVVADTGSWLPGRLILLSPHAFGDLYQDGDSLLVNLTKRQIEESPSIDMHKPVSRQYEDEYYRYYGWPSHWDSLGLGEFGGLPVAPPPPLAELSPAGSSLHGDDPHLRSTKAVGGYRIQTGDGTLGHVADFMLDDKTWALRHLVVHTGHWLAGKDIVLSPEHIDRISYEESTVHVNVTKASIENAPEYRMPRAAYHDSRSFDD